MRTLLLCLALLLPALAAEKPNVIVIMADDLGYGDLSCYGADTYRTPHIDRLAAEGLRFTQGYCSASTCTPTRYSLLTGAYAFRKNGTGIAPPNSPLIIPEDTFTIADLMKSAGYSTAVIGKWHLGLGPKDKGPDWNGELRPGPAEIGFDFHFLLPTTNDRVPQVFVSNSKVRNLDPNDPLWVGSKSPSPEHPNGRKNRNSLKLDWSHGHNQSIHNGISRIGFYTGGHKARFNDEDLADTWVEQSAQWIAKHKNEPFFLFFASHDIHVPRMPHKRFQGKTPHGLRSDAILQLDWSVGEIMKTLEHHHLAENTLVIFCSDNGPVLDDGYRDGAIEKIGSHRAAGILKGGKYSIYEGGTRTPFITYWKGKIQPGTSDNIVCTIDLANSLASLTGASFPANAFPDSFNVLPALLGHPDAKGRSSLVQQDNGHKGNFGYRSGNWKLARHEKGKAFNTVVETKLTSNKVPRIQLFDLSKDPSETNNLAKRHPDIAKRLEAELDAAIKTGRTRP